MIFEKFLVVVGGRCLCDYSFSSGPFKTGIETSLREKSMTMTGNRTQSLKSLWWWWVVVGVSGIIASALVLLRQELRPVIENSL